MTKADLNKVKQLVRLVEKQTGKKIRFTEGPVTVPPKEGDKEKNDVVGKLQEINTLLSDDSVSAFQAKLGNDLGASFQKFVSNLSVKTSEAIQAATGALDEDVKMSVDQAVKDPDTLKKLTDKDVDISLVDDEDELKF